MENRMVKAYCEGNNITIEELRELLRGLPAPSPSDTRSRTVRRAMFNDLLDGASVEEVAQKYGVTGNTVRTAFHNTAREISKVISKRSWASEYAAVTDIDSLGRVSDVCTELLADALRDPEFYGIELTAEEWVLVRGRLEGKSAEQLYEENECLRVYEVAYIEGAGDATLSKFAYSLYEAQRFVDAWNMSAETRTWESAAEAYHTTVAELREVVPDVSAVSGRGILFCAWCDGLTAIQAARSTSYRPGLWRSELKATFGDVRTALNQKKLQKSQKASSSRTLKSLDLQ